MSLLLMWITILQKLCLALASKFKVDSMSPALARGIHRPVVVGAENHKHGTMVDGEPWAPAWDYASCCWQSANRSGLAAARKTARSRILQNNSGGGETGSGTLTLRHQPVSRKIHNQKCACLSHLANCVASLLGAQSGSLNTNRRLLGPWRNIGTVDKNSQLAEGPCSSAMCSHVINRKHSLHQVQANTKPFPWALDFLSYPYLCQLKGVYYDANCETTVLIVVENWRRKGANLLLYCTFVSAHKRCLPADLNKNHALGLASLNTFWRGQEQRVDPFLMATLFGFFEWFV